MINRELEGVRDLWRKNLVPIQRVTALERDAARLEGEHGQLVASVAQAKGKISETELQVIQVDQDLRSEVAKELSEVQAKIAELVEKRVAAEDQLKRIDIRAPQDGMVHQLAVHTIGGVVSPGESIMLIVPRSDTLVIEAKVAPKDIDQVRLGQHAVLRLTAFNQRTTPEIEGTVSLVAADQITDEKTGTSFFKVHVRPNRTSRAAQGDQARAGHAGRGLHPDRRADGALLPDEASQRPGSAGVQGRLRQAGRGAPRRSRQRFRADGRCGPAAGARRARAAMGGEERGWNRCRGRP